MKKLSIAILSLALLAGTKAFCAADDKAPVKEKSAKYQPKAKNPKVAPDEYGGKSVRDSGAAKKSKDKGGQDIQKK